MANTTTKYVVTTEDGNAMDFGNLGLVGKFLGKKITKKDVLAGKFPMVTLQDVTDEVAVDLAHKDEFAKLEREQEDKAHLSKFDTEDTEQGIEVPDDADSLEPAVDEDTHKQSILAKIAEVMESTSDTEQSDLFDRLCELEDAIADGTQLTDLQATLLTQILTNTLGEEDTDTSDTDSESGDVPPTPPSDIEYPEVGDFKDEKAMKKFIKGLSDESLREWCILEGAEWKACDHESINRMRMAMAIKAKHFPGTAPSKGKKSKSKYASYSTEDLVQMALDNDVEVPDDKGDMKICRMYTIMALKKAGLLD